MAREGGQNACRFSIEWSRIEPEEGKFDEKALQHYIGVVKALRERELEPFVTFWHWTLPVWLAKKGGLLAKNFPELFARYAEKVADALGNRVTFYMTVNESNSIIANGYLTGLWPPQKRNIFLAFRAWRRLAEAHREIYHVLKKRYPEAQIGFTEFFTNFFPRRKNSVSDRLLAWILWKIVNERFVARVHGAYDFLGVQNYTSVSVSMFGSQRNTDSKQLYSDLGWGLRAEGMKEVLRNCIRYRVPLYVTEDGVADTEDGKRQIYLEQRIAAMQEIMREGVDVRGYFHWSLLDNFEWDKGFWPRFGLVKVDRETLIRTPRESFWRYKKIIEEHAEKRD